MARLRVIAVENVYVGMDAVEPAIACVYKDNKLHVYDTFGELYYQKEYFPDFNGLKYLINKNKYEWADFYIEKGQLITRDIHGNIIVEGRIIDPFLPFENGKGTISDISVKIYYEFLKTVNKGNSQALSILKNSYESGELKKNIERIVGNAPFKELNNIDKEMIVRTKIDGYQYIINAVKEILKKNDYYKLDEIHYLFSRLFKLEKNNYVEL